jgi:hypothetical protein
MPQRIRWWLILVLILPITISGCDTSRQSSRSSLSDNGRFMDMWGIYTHCSQSEDLDAMRVDAQRLSLAVDVMDPAADPIPSESEEPVPTGPTSRLSVDPAEMAAACALRAGQVAQGMGRLHFAREMFQMIVTNFPQPRYRYYAAQARQGLERLDAVSRSTFIGHTMRGTINMNLRRSPVVVALSSVGMVTLSHTADPTVIGPSKTAAMSE